MNEFRSIMNKIEDMYSQFKAENQISNSLNTTFSFYYGGFRGNFIISKVGNEFTISLLTADFTPDETCRALNKDELLNQIIPYFLKKIEQKQRLLNLFYQPRHFFDNLMRIPIKPILKESIYHCLCAKFGPDVVENICASVIKQKLKLKFSVKGHIVTFFFPVFDVYLLCDEEGDITLFENAQMEEVKKQYIEKVKEVAVLEAENSWNFT